MVKVVFIEHDGNEVSVDVAAGGTLMEAARDHNIDGVVAECGGACACATCHVYVQQDWVGKLAPMSQAEKDMIEFALYTDPTRSRLSCQIVLTDTLDGINIDVPEDQM